MSRQIYRFKQLDFLKILNIFNKSITPKFGDRVKLDSGCCAGLGLLFTEVLFNMSDKDFKQQLKDFDEIKTNPSGVPSSNQFITQVEKILDLYFPQGNKELKEDFDYDFELYEEYVLKQAKNEENFIEFIDKNKKNNNLLKTDPKYHFIYRLLNFSLFMQQPQRVLANFSQSDPSAILNFLYDNKKTDNNTGFDVDFTFGSALHPVDLTRLFEETVFKNKEVCFSLSTESHFMTVFTRNDHVYFFDPNRGIFEVDNALDLAKEYFISAKETKSILTSQFVPIRLCGYSRKNTQRNVSFPDKTEFMKNISHVPDTDKLKGTALMMACRAKDKETLKYLVEEKQYDVNTISGGHPIINYSCLVGDVSGVNYLMSKGALVNSSGDFKMTPLMVAGSSRQNKIFKRLLKEDPSSLENLNTAGYGLIHYACQNQDLETIKAFVENSGDINLPIEQKKTKGITPLAFAVDKGYASIVEYLLENGADPLTLIQDDVSKPALNFSKQGGIPEGQEVSLIEMARGKEDFEIAELLTRYSPKKAHTPRKN